MGYSETMLYSLAPNGHFEIIYPLANDKCALRESIVQKMKESLSANSLNADLLGLDIVKIFEIGKVFPKGGERTVLCMGVNMVKKQKGVKPSNILLDTLKELKDSAGIDLVGSEKINIKDEGFGAIIEIPLDEFISKSSVGDTKDLNFKPLPRSQQYHKFSQYPFIVRDIAVFVPENIVGDGVWQAIKQGLQEAKSAELLIRSALFDVFKKDGKVSYAYRLVFQSYEKTLTDEEVNKIMEAIYNEIKERGWMVR
jgi:phenylalanyl-tRNA synthetase beta subunit